jgi:hypothetical protein
VPTTASKPKPFYLISRATQRALYHRVDTALRSRGDEHNHNDVAEIAASMALRTSDVAVAPESAAGLLLVRKATHILATEPRLANLVSEAARSLCTAPADSVALVACPLADNKKELKQALTFLGRCRLPLLLLVRTAWGKSGPKAIDLRTVHAEFGIPVITVDANDAIAVYRVATEAAHNARVGRGTTIIEAACIANSAESVKSPSPLECLESYMRRHGAWSNRNPKR